MSEIDYRREPEVTLPRVYELLREATLKDGEVPEALIFTPAQRDDFLRVLNESTGYPEMEAYKRVDSFSGARIETKELS